MYSIISCNGFVSAQFDCHCDRSAGGDNGTCECFALFIAKAEKVFESAGYVGSSIEHFKSLCKFESVPQIGLSLRADLQIGATNFRSTYGYHAQNRSNEHIGDDRRLFDSNMAQDVFDIASVSRESLVSSSYSESKPSSNVGGVKGPNYERNKLNREERKKRKKERNTVLDKATKKTGLKFDSVPGKNWERNQVWKARRVARKNRKTGKLDESKREEKCQDSQKEKVDDTITKIEEKDSLRLSLEEKWKAENALAVEKARRSLAVLQQNDVAAEVKKYRTQVTIATEKNMVAIETAHEKLRASGNVALDDESRVHTIFDVPSLSAGSISPNSSASMAEFRKLHKDYLDAEKKIEKMTAAFEKFGLSMDDIDMLEHKEKSVWTDNAENHAILDKMYPDGYGFTYDDAPPGKFVLGY